MIPHTKRVDKSFHVILIILGTALAQSPWRGALACNIVFSLAVDAYTQIVSYVSGRQQRMLEAVG